MDRRIATGTTVFSGGCYPSRAVAYQKVGPSAIRRGHDYFTRIQVLPNDGQPKYEISGHYDLTRQEAMTDFHQRNRKLMETASSLKWQGDEPDETP